MDHFAQKRVNGALGARLGIMNQGDEFARRFRCLRLAAEIAGPTGSAECVRIAGELYAFATNKDARTIRETVMDALNQVAVD